MERGAGGYVKMSDSLVALTLVTALGCGVNAGVFFAFPAAAAFIIAPHVA
jgi:uncharacterized membrane protein